MFGTKIWLKVWKNYQFRKNQKTVFLFVFIASGLSADDEDHEVEEEVDEVDEVDEEEEVDEVEEREEVVEEAVEESEVEEIEERKEDVEAEVDEEYEYSLKVSIVTLVTRLFNHP